MIKHKFFKSKIKSDETKKQPFEKSIGMRLDEYRELVEDIRDNTKLLESHSWHIKYIASQDDYLMRLFFSHYGTFPKVGYDPITQQHVRKRPEILGECLLPEYKEGKK